MISLRHFPEWVGVIFGALLALIGALFLVVGFGTLRFDDSGGAILSIAFGIPTTVLGIGVLCAAGWSLKYERGQELTKESSHARSRHH